MNANGHPSPSEIHSRLSHPVIDADGHWLGYGPVYAVPQNPKFFEGTAVAKAAAAVLAETAHQPAAPVA